MAKSDKWGVLNVTQKLDGRTGKGYVFLHGYVHDRRVREKFGLPQKVQKRFKGEGEAFEFLTSVRAFAETLRSRRRAVETWLSEEQVRMAEWAFQEVGEADFREVVRFGSRAMPKKSTLTLHQWLLELEKELDANGRQYRTISSMRGRVQFFLDRTAAIHPTDFSKEIVGRFFDNLDSGTVSRKNYRTALHQFGEFLVRREAIVINPVKGIVKPKTAWTPPKVAQPEEVRALLRAAREHRPRRAKQGCSLCYLVFGFFSGARPDSELSHFTPRELFREVRELHVMRSKTTSGSQRVIALNPTLIRWIDYLTEHDLLFFEMTPERRRLVCERAGVRWKQDWMRHSYATYWLPANEWDVESLAKQMGTSKALIRKNYWNLARGGQDRAAEFWALTPEEVFAEGA